MKNSGIISQIARIREKANIFIEKELKLRSMKGIKPAHGSILHYLFQQCEPVPIKAIVEHVRRVKSTVTGMIKTLEKNGYIRRIPCPEDCRMIYIELTERGRILEKDFYEISEQLLRKVYGSMEREASETLTALLECVEGNLDS